MKDIEAVLLAAGTTGDRQVWFTRPEVLNAMKEIVRQATPTDDEIMAVWKATPAQGDPTGMKFAVTFARAILEMK